jgi:uncharacterized membrane protein YtjA (UPF0391 family)
MIKAQGVERRHKRWPGNFLLPIAADEQKSWNGTAKAFFLLSYVLCGFLHELAHVVTAKSLGYQNESGCMLSYYWGILLGRVSFIPALESANDWEIAMVRHAGWLASFLVFLLIWLVVNSTKKWNIASRTCLVSAAAITLVEALMTDLFGFGGVASMSPSSSKMVFFCGNFGVIMLNDSWVNTSRDNGKTVLDLLEKMVSITMMRGGE